MRKIFSPAAFDRPRFFLHLLAQGQFDDEGRALIPARAADADFTGMKFHQLAGDGQTQAQTAEAMGFIPRMVALRKRRKRPLSILPASSRGPCRIS